MSDYIKREDALDAIGTITMYKGSIPHDLARRKIESIPSADVAPVRRGKWRMTFMDDRYSRFYGMFRFTCSSCGYYEDKDYSDSMDDVNYCPNCGARMEDVTDV